MALARVLLVFVVGCAGPTMASLQRTGCYGWCPIYKLAVHSDGRIDYHGERFVKQTGDVTGKLTLVQLLAVRQAFATASYFGLADKYEQYSITDMSSASTSFTDGGRTKSISHYRGDTSAPESLAQLEDQIDHIVAIETWIGSEQEREAHRGDWR
ncbi:MAG TPA: DUF6438 domain-containing protein [Kofleriaceae bacterium]|jgi:hypothetical protein